MKIKDSFLPLLLLFCVLGFTSCSDNDGPGYSASALKNAELMTILKSKGYTFDQEGKLELNDLANNTTSLDLSGTKIADFTGLDILPNLKEVKLSNNGYGPSFDFSKLPAQITGVDLTGNEIFEYANLIDVKVEENGDETITDRHSLTKLYLPAEAKYDMKTLVRFYRQHKNDVDAGKLDMKMADAKGSLQAYNTLREIPDEFLLTYFKKTFPSIMASDGKHVDLSKRLDNKDKTADFQIYVEKAKDPHPKSVEGVQYILSNPYWEGNNFMLNIPEKVELPYLEIADKLQQLFLLRVDVTHGINFEGAKSLCRVMLQSVAKMSEVDLSKSSLFGQRGASTELSEMGGTIIALVDCPDLTTVTFPQKEVLRAAQMEFVQLPKLSSIDLLHFTGVGTLNLGNLNAACKLTYPAALKEWFDYGGYLPNDQLHTDFACTEDIFNHQETKDFIKKFYKESTPKRLRCSSQYLYANNSGLNIRGISWKRSTYLDLIK